MAISQTRLDEFIALYEKAHGERLNRDEAEALAERVIGFYRLLTQPPSSAPAGTGLEAPEG